MPFVYPLFGPCLMAVTTETFGVLALEHLCWPPGLFYLLAVIMFFELARRIDRRDPRGNEQRGARAALLGCGHDPGTRAAARIGSLVIAWRAVERGSLRLGAAGGLLFRLTTLTRLTYARFFAIGLLVLVVGGRPLLRRIQVGALIAVVGARLATPWVLMNALRHRPEVVTAASLSHGGPPGPHLWVVTALGLIARLVNPTEPALLAWHVLPLLGVG